MFSDDYSLISSTLKHMYDGEDPLSSIISGVTQKAGACGAVLIPLSARKPGCPHTESVGQLVETYFGKGWYEQDARQVLAPRLVQHKVAVDQDFITSDEMKRHPFWQDFLEPHGFRWFCGLHLRLQGENWALALQRRVGKDPFSREEQAKLAIASDEISSAANLFGLLHDTRLRGLCDGLDAMGAGALLLDRHERLIESNAHADRLIGSIIHVARGRIVIVDDDIASAALHKYVAEVAACARPETHPERMVFARRPDGRTLCIKIRSLVQAPFEYLARARVLLTITEAVANKTPNIGQLQVALSLSAGEARLLAAFSRSANLRKSATEAGLTYETARIYMRRIFAKAGVRNQIELAAFLAGNDR